MIMRLWRGQATAANADAYFRHVTETVFPSLTALPGHRGAYLVRREVADRTEFLAVTFWESREAIEGFAGPNIDMATVEPKARAILAEFDDFARHYQVVFDSRS
jgi:hypothetical protein